MTFFHGHWDHSHLDFFKEVYKWTIYKIWRHENSYLSYKNHLV